MLEEIYWTSQYLHVLAIIILFVKVWWDQDCSGISIKSQCLYALVFTTRYLDLFTTFISIQDTILKAALVIFNYGTALPMIIFFSKSYEKEHDKARILLPVISCAAIAFWVHREFTVLEVLWAFSVYLEAVAMIPQFQFFAMAKGIHKHMIFYIATMTIYKALCVVYWDYQYDYNDKSFLYNNLSKMYLQQIYVYNYIRHSYQIQIAAGVVQLLYYCDFFIRIVPKLSIRRDEDQSTVVASDEADIENGISKTSHFTKNCVRVAALTPNFLHGAQNNKVERLTAENFYVLDKC